MATSPSYASVPKIEAVLITTGDTSRTAPTVASTAFVPGNSGSRITAIRAQFAGTVTGTMLRLFLVDCQPGPIPTSITFVTTTATVTTPTPHGLTTGDKITVRGAFPRQYNVTDVAVTVSSTTVFTYTMTSAPTVNAVSVGNYITTPSTASYILLDEVPLSANTPSSTTEASSIDVSGSTSGLYPFIISSNKLLRATINDTTSPGVTLITIGADL